SQPLALHSSFERAGHPRELHSFPTRRSSDLSAPLDRAQDGGALALVDQAGQNLAVSRHRFRAGFPIGFRHLRLLDRADLPLEVRSEEHTSELQSRENLVCRLLLEKKNNNTQT